MKTNVIIARAGKNSRHLEWLRGAEPNFDLIVLAYEDLPETLTRDVSLYVVIRGAKVVSWSQFFDERPDILAPYQQIAMIDDDIECDAVVLNACFALGEQHDLRIWQPSLTYDSYFSYAITINSPAFVRRYVNFIEMMCPFFAKSALIEIMPFFQMGLRGWHRPAVERQLRGAGKILRHPRLRDGRP